VYLPALRNINSSVEVQQKHNL